MSRINDGIGQYISGGRGNAQGVASATREVYQSLQLQLQISKEHAVENVESSKQLMNEINHFQKI